MLNIRILQICISRNRQVATMDRCECSLHFDHKWPMTRQGVPVCVQVGAGLMTVGKVKTREKLRAKRPADRRTCVSFYCPNRCTECGSALLIAESDAAASCLDHGCSSN